ncbi:MAG: glutamate--tRNA ligase [bacterium]|nr:glutamate--tRNA ligase [bacterium]
MSPTNKKQVRVRIAPSPTGYLHIGTARTALFNWLFAKQNNGVFVLRIEDTDLERSEEKYEKDIIESLKWLGLDWDEGPIKQTDRLEVYEKYLNQLLAEGSVYYCFCSKEQLEEERQAMLAQGFGSKYSGRCRLLTAEQVKENLKSTASHVIRLKVPETKITFTDIIRGDITFDAALMGDIAIAKDPRVPLYNFAVVVDDEEMAISHVIRGEDHIANTPKQILIQKALGFGSPEYGHIPLILNADRSKMSKRFSATSINEYREKGYLPETMVNFMALLGWHPAPQPSVEARGKSAVVEKEIFTAEELVKEFDINRIQKAGAIFNVDKLDWLNAQYIKKMDSKDLAKLLKVKDTEQNLRIVEATKERLKKLSDFQEMAGFFVEVAEYNPALLIWKTSTKEKTLANLKEAEQIISAIISDDFAKNKLDKVLMPIAEARGKGDFLWPIRIALSGLEKSPGPFEIMEVIGKKETLVRVAEAIKLLGK